MVIAIFYILGLLAGAIAVIFSVDALTIQFISKTILRYFLPVGVGAPLIISSIGHVFKSDLAARRLGWAAGSPFHKEVGFWDGAGRRCPPY